MIYVNSTFEIIETGSNFENQIWERIKFEADLNIKVASQVKLMRVKVRNIRGLGSNSGCVN